MESMMSTLERPRRRKSTLLGSQTIRLFPHAPEMVYSRHVESNRENQARLFLRGAQPAFMVGSDLACGKSCRSGCTGLFLIKFFL